MEEENLQVVLAFLSLFMVYTIQYTEVKKPNIGV
jgi:hypothetical protein